MSITPPGSFWREVRAQAVAGTLVVVATGTLGGIGYLVHTVPNKLDEVLNNQLQFKTRLDKLESEESDHAERIVRLEAQR